MTRKILMILGTLALITMPFFVLAQFPKAVPSDCCKLKHEISNSVTYPENAVVSALAVGATCHYKDTTATVTHSTPDWGGVCTMDTIYTATDAIFWFFIAFVVIMGIYVGIMFMTAGGDPGKIEKARSMLMYLVIGIIVAIAVKLIPSFARAIIGV